MARGALKGLKRTRPAPGDKGQLAQGNGGRSPGHGTHGSQGDFNICFVLHTLLYSTAVLLVKLGVMMLRSGVCTSLLRLATRWAELLGVREIGPKGVDMCTPFAGRPTSIYVLPTLRRSAQNWYR